MSAYTASPLRQRMIEDMNARAFVLHICLIQCLQCTHLSLSLCRIRLRLSMRLTLTPIRR